MHKKKILLDDFAILFIRKNPPFDQQYLTITYLLETLKTDKNSNKTDALNDIYKVLRPGEAPTVEIAEEVFKNLYFVGAGTHPGGGLTGISGKNAAKAVLDDF